MIFIVIKRFFFVNFVQQFIRLIFKVYFFTNDRNHFLNVQLISVKKDNFEVKMSFMRIHERRLFAINFIKS